jgi:hypothetical protein
MVRRSMVELAAWICPKTRSLASVVAAAASVTVAVVVASVVAVVASEVVVVALVTVVVVVASAVAVVASVTVAVEVALAVVVAYFGSAVCCTARPIFAGVLQAIAKRRAIGFGARQNIVLVGFVQLTGHHLTLLSQCRGLVDQVAIAAISDGITVQMAEIARDAKTYLVMPRPRANPITSVHGICRALRRGTEISAPSVVACARGLGQLLTMRISPHEPSQISPIAGACTGEEKRHGPFGCGGRNFGGLLGERRLRAQTARTQKRDND